jgi:hypothetical protein
MTPTPLSIPTLVVIGGGDIGATTVRQLSRAVQAKRLETRAIVVVDRDPNCVVARSRPCLPVRVETSDWSDWLDASLDELGADDHLVPYHWAPHLFLTWIRRQATRAGAVVTDGAPVPSRGLPFEAATSAGDRALSYAAWVCPPLCIEPELCPHTRGPRDWSLARDLDAHSAGEGSIVFPCLHAIYGVGTIPVALIRAARDRVLAGFSEGARSWRIATASHCHGLARSLQVALPPG